MGALAVVDCPTGLAGNMLLAALFDCGLPDDAVHEPLAALGLGGLYRLQLEERRSAGLRGCTLRWNRSSSSRPTAIGPTCASRSRPPRWTPCCGAPS